MNKFLVIVFFFFVCQSKADFDSATEAYANKNFKPAYDEYHRLAKIGNKRAQFNLGVMYLHGEYVKKNLLKAYAWGRLSENNDKPEFSNLRKSLHKEFNPDELKQAEDLYLGLVKQYGDEQIFEKLSPISYEIKNNLKKRQWNLEPLRRKPPMYPKEAYAKGIQGWVTVGFEVFPDGSTRSPYVIESYPEGVFDRNTLEALSGFKFGITFNDGVEPYPIMARQTFQYEMKTRDSASTKNKLRQIYQQRLNRLQEFADQGSAQAQYIYAIAGSSNVIPKENRIPPEEVNQWLLKSAQNGHVQAQYHLGRNILRGKGCKVEKQKGLDWIVYAAEQGHSKSSRMAYKLLTKSNQLNNTENSPEHWLKMAADNGDPESQLDYAHHLIFNSDDAKNNLSSAKSLLENYRNKRDRNVKFYQVSAQIYRLESNDKKAEKAQKKANKLAKKLGWDI